MSRTLIATEFVTLDGVMEAPGGETTHPHTGWVMAYMSPEQQQYKLRETLDADTLLIGRVTYESFAGSWPTYEGEFADKMNSMEKVVVSTTLTEPEWSNSRVLPGDDVVAGVKALKDGDGGPILLAGSSTLLHTLLDADLVDELRLMVFPLSIGHGLRVFPDTRKRTEWQRVATETFPTGVRVDTYHPT